AAAKKGEDTPYATWDALRAEDREEAPAMVLTVTDESGNVIRRLTGPASAGLQRVTWNLRWPSPNPVTGAPQRRRDDSDGGPSGPIVAPGTYRVQLAKRVDGALTALGEPQSFQVEPASTPTLPLQDRAQVVAFYRKAADLQRAVMGSQQALTGALQQLSLLQRALDETPTADLALRQEATALENRLRDLQVELAGDQTIASRSESTPPAISDRVQNMISGTYQTLYGPTATHRRDYDIAAEAFGAWLPRLKQVVESDMKALQARAEAAGAPWTPGRVPEWKP
ncbi:MAG: hypothetical protein H6R40_886, partial [Gemmatimonadetes bacterium]|nr:hypothetical protein [Gemmatimonadota bacterium]